eukprot:scaffold14097_cov107-Isochrysis_galbana.AAC.5
MVGRLIARRLAAAALSSARVEARSRPPSRWSLTGENWRRPFFFTWSCSAAALPGRRAGVGMTTAHRPTFHAAIGGKEQGGGRYVAGVTRVHVHDLASQTSIKKRYTRSRNCCAVAQQG